MTNILKFLGGFILRLVIWTGVALILYKILNFELENSFVTVGVINIFIALTSFGTTTGLRSDTKYMFIKSVGHKTASENILEETEKPIVDIAYTFRTFVCGIILCGISMYLI